MVLASEEPLLTGPSGKCSRLNCHQPLSLMMLTLEALFAFRTSHISAAL
jgi:hypothetical protein